jgi:hypothetical protein
MYLRRNSSRLSTVAHLCRTVEFVTNKYKVQTSNQKPFAGLKVGNIILYVSQVSKFIRVIFHYHANYVNQIL